MKRDEQVAPAVAGAASPASTTSTGSTSPGPRSTGSTSHSTVLLEVLRRSHEVEPHRVGALADEAARRLGARGSLLFLIGLQQRLLVPVGADGEPVGDPLPVEGTVAGRTYVTGRRHLAPDNGGGGVAVWVPLIDGSDRLGVLELHLDDAPADGDLWPEDLATAIGLLLSSKTAYTDAYIRAARTRTATVAAELIWSLLPPLTLATPQVSVAGILEPAYEIGGDTFDYAASGDELVVGVFDSMGHGLQAAQPSALAVSAMRNARRRGLGVEQAATEVDQLLGRHYGGERFVTALLLELSLRSGLLRWVNAGHPQPLLVREGRVRGAVPGISGLPLGLELGVDARPVNELAMQPGDRVVLYTDGVTEGRRPGGEPFGETRLAEELDKAALAGLDTAETMRRAAHAVLDHHQHELRDDFTMVLVEFRQPLPRSG